MWKWLLIVLAGCQQPRTELMIGVATDLKAPMVLDSAQLIITRTKDGVVQQMVSWDISGVPNQPFNLPGSYGVYSDGEEVQVAIELQGLKAGRAVVNRHATLNLIEGKTLFFRMGLTAGCVDNTSCAPTESCIEGVCSDRVVDSRRLPDFEPDLPTTLTCQSGAAYIDTSTNAPMRFSEDAMMCPAGFCAEGTCLKPPPGDGVDTGPDGGTSTLPLQRYVVDRQTLPTNNTEARNLGLDLNGDMTVDNQLGMVLGTFAGMGIDPIGPVVTSVDRGTVIDLVELGVTDFANSMPAHVRLLGGTNPQPAPCNGGTDVICRRHLMGTGTFDIDQTSPLTQPLQGKIVNGVFTTNAGTTGELTLRTVLLGTLQLDLFAAHVKITSVSQSGLMQGIIAGAVRQADVQNALVPAWASTFNAQMQADCTTGVPPSCGCPGGSTGNTIKNLFDVSSNDCVITVSEVQNNSLIQSLLAPDISANGQVGLSLGIGFSAVPAQF